MVHRKQFEAPGDYSIAVAAERMKDGKWSAVTTIQQSTQTGERNIDLPISDARFATEDEPRPGVDREERPAAHRPPRVSDQRDAVASEGRGIPSHSSREVPTGRLLLRRAAP